MAFLTGLMKGAALEDQSQNACSANPIVHRSLDSNYLVSFDWPSWLLPKPTEGW